LILVANVLSIGTKIDDLELLFRTFGEFRGICQMALTAAAVYDNIASFLADRTNGRAYATVLRLSSSSSVCNVIHRSLFTVINGSTIKNEIQKRT